MAKYVPNILTIIRFFIIPFIIVFALQNNYIIAIIFLVISGITDVADGFIARKFNYITDFGKLMDPLADKCTQIATLLVLVIQEIIPVWILVVVVIKEVILVAGASFLYGKDLVVSSKWYGKISTVLFYVAIFCSMLIKQFQLPYTFDNYIYYIAIGLTVFSLVMYWKAFYVKDFLKKEK
mgnify:CR=1 FL=1